MNHVFLRRSLLRCLLGVKPYTIGESKSEWRA
jgi:hypothetical protein